MEEALKKIEEIVSEIRDLPQYKNYLEAKNKMGKNKKINNLINEIKLLQKEIVRGNKKEKNEKKLENTLVILEGIPLYQEFRSLEIELNSLLTSIEKSINDYFSDKLS